MSRLRSHNHRAAKARRRQIKLEGWFRNARYSEAFDRFHTACAAAAPALARMGDALAEVGRRAREVVSGNRGL